MADRAGEAQVLKALGSLKTAPLDKDNTAVTANDDSTIEDAEEDRESVDVTFQKSSAQEAEAPNAQQEAGEREGGESAGQAVWLPPGADDASGSEYFFEDALEEGFWVPPRLLGKSEAMVSAVNDFHYAMINDVDRNEFYNRSLRKCVTGSSVVLEIGAGSGLLSMIAAKHGAKKVFAIEANQHMCKVAQMNIEKNALQERISLVNKLSTHVVMSDFQGFEEPHVLVSEILGSLLLSESALDYVHDARDRLLCEDPVIIPASGVQYATLIESNDLAMLTSVDQKWGDLDLGSINAFKDTANLCFTKQFGFRLSSLKYNRLCKPIPVFEVDFYTDQPGSLPAAKRIRFVAERSGTVTAVMTSWEVFGDKEKTIRMSTDPEDTKDNFNR